MKKLTFGSDAEFFERSDGYDGLVDTYWFQFKKKVTIDPDLQYEAAKNGEIDVITAYTTDARINKTFLFQTKQIGRMLAVAEHI
nr:glycine betaine ABC transporter substrate-binding protein [Geobacillus sp. FJAT-46040]